MGRFYAFEIGAGLFLATKNWRIRELSHIPDLFAVPVQPPQGPLDKGGVCWGSIRKLQVATQGAVSVEYTVLMVAVAVSSSAAIFAIGMPLVLRYQFMKLLIGLPLP